MQDTAASEAQQLSGPGEVTSKSAGRYAWYVVLVLMLCYTLSFVDRQILSLLVKPIKHDLGLSDVRVGLLQGFAFAIFYTLMGIPLGRIADTRSRRTLIACGIFLWSLMTAACAAAMSFWSLFSTRIGVGVGEATLSPAAFSLISDYFPKKRLNLALSIYSMGIELGAGLAFLVGSKIVEASLRIHSLTLPILGAVAPWRISFLAVGFPGLLFVLLVYTIKEPARLNVLRNADGQASKLSLREVIAQTRLRWQSLLGLSFIILFQAMAGYGFLAWGPTYFQRVHGWSIGHAGRTMGIMIILFGCAGMYVGGMLSDHWQHKKIREGPLWVGVISAIGTGVFLPLALLLPNVTWTVALMSAGTFFQAMAIGSTYAALQVIFPNQVRGQVSAVLMFIINIGGLSLGPLLPGVFNDYWFKDENMIGPSLALTVGIASICMLLSAVAIFRAYRRHHGMMHPEIPA